jgi:hypothetical protein
MHAYVVFYESVLHWISGIQRNCTEATVSINRQKQTHWPICSVYWWKTTDSLTYMSRLLHDNDRRIDLFFSSFDEQRIHIDLLFSSIDGHRQTHWPTVFVYWYTTTDQLTYLFRLLTNNDRPIYLFISFIVGQRQYALTYFSPYLDKVVR